MFMAWETHQHLPLFLASSFLHLSALGVPDFRYYLLAGSWYPLRAASSDPSPQPLFDFRPITRFNPKCPETGRRAYVAAQVQ